MPAVQSSSNLVELIQTLQSQQQEYAAATESVTRTLEEQLRQHAEAAAAIGGTLDQISGLLSALVGGLGGVMQGARGAAPRPAAVAVKAAGKPAAKPQAKGGSSAGAEASKSAGGGRGGIKAVAAGQHPLTGSESVLAFVKQKNNPTSADIAAHWKGEGRGGSADNVLGQLVKDGALKRRPNESGRGSRYVVG